jgi:predicted dehydrogenase
MLKAAIVGLGRYADRLVSPVQGVSEKIRFVAASTRDPANGVAFAARHGLRLARDYAGVLDDPEVEAVVHATPHSLHAEQTQQAARAGKHVFVEKPFTLTRASAEETVAVCRQHGIVLAVGFHSRFYPAVLELQKAVRSGVVGEILHVEAHISGPPGGTQDRSADHWRRSRAEQPAGGMTGKGVHLLDLMIALCGPVDSVFARSERRMSSWDLDDVTSMLLHFKGGASGYLATLLATAVCWRLQVLGSAGWAEVRDQTRLTIQPLEGAAVERVLPDSGARRAELEAFADAVKSGTPYPVTPADAVAGAAALEAVEQSAARGAEVRIA